MVNSESKDLPKIPLEH